MSEPAQAAASTASRVPVAPNDRRRLHGSIAHDIAVDIVSGRYRPGDVLPNEDTFSQRLSVSRTAYREAVRILAAKGLVESRPKTGTRICDRTRWNFVDPDVLAWHLETEPSERFVADLFELRVIVEPAAAALAAERRSADDLAVMRRALEAMQADGLVSELGWEADLAFHHAVLAASRNEALVALSSGIGTTVRWSTILKRREGTMQPDPVDDHWAVYQAIEAGDGPVARLRMAVLVEAALATTLAAMRRR